MGKKKREREIHLQVVEVADSADPVHQQSNLGAGMYVRCPGLFWSWLDAAVGPDGGQPLFGPKGSL